MPKGGARARSGPAKDPTSARSEKLAKAAAKRAATQPPGAVSVTALPSEGYRGRPPAFPLPKVNRYTDEGRVHQAATTAFRAREMSIWREVWKTPQAAAWSLDPWRWPTVGEYCRAKATVELDFGGSAALLSRLREYRIEIGLTPDGLKMNGWAIAPNQVAQQAAKKAAATKTAAKKTQPTRRLRSVGGNGSS